MARQQSLPNPLDVYQIWWYARGMEMRSPVSFALRPAEYDYLLRLIGKPGGKWKYERREEREPDGR